MKPVLKATLVGVLCLSSCSHKPPEQVGYFTNAIAFVNGVSSTNIVIFVNGVQYTQGQPIPLRAKPERK